MAGRGPAPKGKNARERDQVQLEALEVTGERFGPDLPEGVLPDGEDWHPQTRVFWESLRTFPLLKHEPDLGWQTLVDTALMHHIMWTKGRWEFASEIRLRVAKYGATPEDRMRLRIKVEFPADQKAGQPAKAGTVTNIGSRRARLTS